MKSNNIVDLHNMVQVRETLNLGALSNLVNNKLCVYVHVCERRVFKQVHDYLEKIFSLSTDYMFPKEQSISPSRLQQRAGGKGLIKFHQ